MIGLITQSNVLEFIGGHIHKFPRADLQAENFWRPSNHSVISASIDDEACVAYKKMSDAVRCDC